METQQYISKHSIFITRLFLSIFNLKIEEQDYYETTKKHPIFNSENNKVGEFYLRNNTIIITSNYDNNMLNAKINDNTKENINDEENAVNLSLIDNNILFLLFNRNSKIDGKLQIRTINDSQLGKRIECHPTINYNNLKSEKISIKILKEGSIFNCQYQNKDFKEEISFKPFLGSIYHRITNGEYNIGRESYPYQLYVGVFDHHNDNKLHLFLREEKERETIKYKNYEVNRNNIKDSEEDLIEKGKEMQKIDPNITTRINEIIQYFNISDNNILKSLMTLSYEKYSTKEIYALLGVTKDESPELIELINNYLQTQNNKKLTK